MLISVLTHNRSDISIKSIESLIKAIRDSSVVINDDGSKEDRIKDYLKILHLKNAENVFSITSNLYPKNRGVEYSNITRLDFLNDYPKEKIPEYVYLTDNDMMYSSNFYNKLKEMECILRKYPSILCGTLFHSTNGGSHISLGNFETSGFLIKKSFGGCSILIRTKDFIDAMYFYTARNYAGKQGWDWGLCHYAKIYNRILISTYKSYVEHIGVNGVNSNALCYDKADEFIP